MGSEQFAALEKQGIKRGGGEPCQGPPESFAIIGLDITAEKLLARYSGESAAHRRACAVIRGVRDRTRTATPPPAWFVASIGSGQEQRVIVANLGPDAKNRVWVVVCIGRKRTMALRTWNAEAKPEDRRELLAEIRGFRHTSSIDAELAALEANAASNVFVPMAPSEMADHAAMLKEKGVPASGIAIKIGARDAEHAEQLLALAQCAPVVWEAVDAGRFALGECAALVRLNEEEQARRVSRATAAPKGANGKADREARNAAAPPRPKALPRAHVLALAEQLEAQLVEEGASPTYTSLDVAVALRYALGDGDALHAAGVSDRMQAMLQGMGKSNGVTAREAAE